MSVEHIHLVKRTVYTAACDCGETDVKTENPPRERLCKCGKWVAYKEESYTGPDLGR